MVSIVTILHQPYGKHYVYKSHKNLETHKSMSNQGKWKRKFKLKS